MSELPLQLSARQVGEFLNSGRSPMIAAGLDALAGLAPADIVFYVPTVFGLRDDDNNRYLDLTSSLANCGEPAVRPTFDQLAPGQSSARHAQALYVLEAMFSPLGSKRPAVSTKCISDGDLARLIELVNDPSPDIRGHVVRLLAVPEISAELKRPGLTAATDKLLRTLTSWFTDMSAHEQWFQLAQAVFVQLMDLAVPHLNRCLRDAPSIVRESGWEYGSTLASVVANRAARVVVAGKDHLPQSAAVLIPELIRSVRWQNNGGKYAPCQALQVLGAHLGEHTGEIASLLEQVGIYERQLLAGAIAESGPDAVTQHLMPLIEGDLGEWILDMLFYRALNGAEAYRGIVPKLLELLAHPEDALAVRAAHVLAVIGSLEEADTNIAGRLHDMTARIEAATMSAAKGYGPGQALTLAIHLLAIHAVEGKNPQLLQFVRSAIRLERRRAAAA